VCRGGQAKLWLAGPAGTNCSGCSLPQAAACGRKRRRPDDSGRESTLHEPTIDPENGKEKAVPARRAGVSRRLAFFCLVAGALVLGTRGVLSLVVKRPPPPLLPPAGKGLGGKAPFRFAVLGDNRGVKKSFTDILRGIKAEQVRFVLHTGDIVRGANREQFDWVRQELACEHGSCLWGVRADQPGEVRSPCVPADTKSRRAGPDAVRLRQAEVRHAVLS